MSPVPVLASSGCYRILLDPGRMGKLEYYVGFFGIFILTLLSSPKDSEDNPQTLLFSATCPHWVYNVAKKYMKSTYEQVDLIGKKTQKTAITVEVNDLVVGISRKLYTIFFLSDRIKTDKYKLFFQMNSKFM